MILFWKATDCASRVNCVPSPNRAGNPRVVSRERNLNSGTVCPTQVARACGVESAMITGGALRRDRKDGGASGCAHLEFRSVVAAKMVADRISEGASVRGHARAASLRFPLHVA